MRLNNQKTRFPNKAAGFTMIETLIGAVIFLIVAVGVYQSLVGVIKIVQSARTKTDAMLLANEQVEIIRNMPYAEIGLVGGTPAGGIEQIKYFSRNGSNFKVTTAVQDVDDPFDGTIGGTPNDASAADYKRIEIEVECLSGCRHYRKEKITTTVAPRSAETETGNGALFIQVIDANGQPVPGANVRIINNSAVPAISINDTTRNDGSYQLVNTPPGSLAYAITASKSGYSQSQTYLPGAESNPNPVLPHTTVAAGQVTQITFSIDRLANLEAKTANDVCSPIANVPVDIRGEKIIGSNPTVYKYDENKATNASGVLSLSGLEWDTYHFSLGLSSPYDLAGSLPLLPVSLNPAANQELTLVLKPRQPNSLLVAVKDAVTGLPLSGAQVKMTRGEASTTEVTSRGYFLQTNWNGGGGQINYSNSSRFAESTNVDYGQEGEIKLSSFAGQFSTEGNLVSSVFDTGATSTYFSLQFNPADQATSTGEGSVKLQIASSNTASPETWNFVGPDGTAGSYYTVSNSAISSGHNNRRYVRYKVILSTVNPNFSPQLSDVSVTYSSECLPYGQAFFQNLALDTYQLNVSRESYQPYANNTLLISNDWQRVDVLLQPE